MKARKRHGRFFIGRGLLLLLLAAGSFFAYRLANPPLPWSELLAQAESLHRARRYTVAARKAEAALDGAQKLTGPSSTDFLRVMERLAEFYADAGEWANLTALSKRLDDSTPKTPELLRCEGTALLRLEELQRAAAAFEKALSLKRGDAALYADLGHAYAEEGRYADAVKTLRKALRLDPHSYGILMELGRAYQMEGDYPKSIMAYARARKESPQAADAYIQEGYARLAHADDPAAAKNLFKKAAALTSDGGRGQHHLSEFYRLTGHRSKAMALLKSALNKQSLAPPAAAGDTEDPARTLLHIGNALQQSGDHAGALRAFQSAIKAATLGTEPWFMVLSRAAATAQGMGQLGKARDYFLSGERLCAKNGGHPRDCCFGVLALHAMLERQAGNFAEAERLYHDAKIARSLDTDRTVSYGFNSQYLARAGVILGHERESGRLYRDLIASARKAYKTDAIVREMLASLYKELAELYDKMGRHQEAETLRAELSRRR